MARDSNLRRLLIPILLVLSVRLLLVGFFGPAEAPDYADTSVYHSVSKRLSTSADVWAQPGSEFGYRAPLYFVYLAGIYFLYPQSGYRAGQIATLLLGLVTCFIVYRFVRLLEGERTAWVAFWVRGLLVFFVVADTFVMTEPLFSALQLGAILVFLSAPSAPNWKRAILLGVLVGFCMLTKEAAIAYPVIFGGGICLLRGAISKKMISVLLFFCALTISLLPWMWRNEIVWGRPLPLAHTSGANLYIGNNPNATGHWIDPPEKPPPGIRPGSPEASRWYTDQGIRFIKAHPKCFFVNGFKKIAWVLFPSFHRDDMLNIYDAPARLLTGISLLSGGMSALFILCGLTGFILKKPDRFWWLSASIIIYHLATSFVAVGHPRFRDPVDHIFIYYASSLLVNWRCIWSDIKSGSVVVRRKIRLLTLTFIFIVVNWTIVILAKVGGPPK